MNTYLTLAACRGRRPRPYVKTRLHSRPALVSRLMAERQVARFVVAPPRYGKGCLALEYVQTVFELNHVFWLDAASPCFLRDLDKGSMAESVFELDPQAACVVVASVPRMGTERADEFSRCVDLWLDNGCEVLVLAHPGSDAFARRQPDRICLTAADLLLGAEDFPEDAALPVFADAAEEDAPFDLRQIAGVTWGGEDASAAFARRMAREALPRDLRFLFFLVMLLGPVAADQLRPLLQRDNLEGLGAVFAQYPHLGYREDRDRFEPLALSVEDLASAYKTLLPGLVEASTVEDVPCLVTELASYLVALGRPARACHWMRLVGTKEVRRLWALSWGPRLLDVLCVQPLCQLLGGLRLTAEQEAPRIRVLEAQGLLLLGRQVDAAAVASKTLASPRCTLEDGDQAAYVLMRTGATERREAAVRHAVARKDALRPHQLVRLCLEQEVSAFPQVWEAVLASDASPEEVALAAAEACSLYPDCALPVLLDYLGTMDQGEQLRLTTFLALKAIRRHEDTTANLGLLPGGWSLAYYQAQASLVQQGRDHAVACQVGTRSRQSLRRAGAFEPLDLAPLDLAPLVAEVPVEDLEVRICGGVEVFVGGRLIDPNLLRRNKLRALLGVLVLNAGREVSRDRLVSSLWPNTALSKGRKNLYTVWSQLRKALASDQDTCPYLFHARGGYKLDDRHLSSDIGRLRQLCNQFTFDPVDVSLWVADLQELLYICQGELVPGEDDNPLILSAREEYQVRVVNALVAASGRLLAEGAAETALWFAQAALDREVQREDVYYALMSAQVACGQREAALRTFNQDKRFLADSLGIDPSARMVALYRQVIAPEEDFW